MRRALTSESRLETLRKDAKRWLKAVRAGDAAARARLVAARPKAPDAPVLRDIQQALAREYGRETWIALKAALDDLALDRKTHAERVEALLRHGWGCAFTVLTGAVRLGEGARPSHVQAVELVELLIEAGAKPFDIQTLYHVSIVGEPLAPALSWYDLLWRHCEAPGETDPCATAKARPPPAPPAPGAWTRRPS